MSQYSEYKSYCEKETFTHLTEFLLQAFTSLTYSIISRFADKKHKYLLLNLSNIHLVDSTIELLTAIGHMPYFNIFGYYLSDDNIPDNEESIGKKELYSQKTEIFNRATPILIWKFLEHKKIIPLLISSEVYSLFEISMTLFRIIYYKDLSISDPKLNYNSSNSLLNDYHLHSYIETKAIAENLIIPIYVLNNIVDCHYLTLYSGNLINEIYLEYSKGLEFKALDIFQETFTNVVSVFDEDISKELLLLGNTASENLT